MITNKNRSVIYKGKSYELFLTFKDAQHICRSYHDKEDNARHLDFLEIEQLILSGTFTFMGKSRYFIIGKLNGKHYMVVAYLIGRRMVVKSGRICNYTHLY